LAEWHYIGNYGQIGPIGDAQVRELISVGGITPDTLVWRPGLSEWVRAKDLPELASQFPQPIVPPVPSTPPGYSPAPRPDQAPLAYGPRRSRLATGVLQLFLPGVGRMYAGYVGLGVAQLIVAVATCGYGALWSFIDGILILTGNVQTDGEGRPFRD